VVRLAINSKSATPGNKTPAAGQRTREFMPVLEKSRFTNRKVRALATTPGPSRIIRQEINVSGGLVEDDPMGSLWQRHHHDVAPDLSMFSH
jgi:hypothetical protein